MCGRFTLGTDTDRLVAEFGIGQVVEPHTPRYNIAPTQPVPVVVRSDAGLRLGALRWGLVPHWARDPAIGGRLINARSETVDRKPAFRDAFRLRRCWVLADGFYEWRRGSDGGRTPYHFRLPDARPFAFAGVWDRWRGGNEAIVSVAILTAPADPTVAPVHDRMPVILPPDRRPRWLDPAAPTDELRDLLRPSPVQGFPVSRRVNSTDNEGPELREPADPIGPRET